MVSLILRGLSSSSMSFGLPLLQHQLGWSFGRSGDIRPLRQSVQDGKVSRLGKFYTACRGWSRGKGERVGGGVSLVLMMSCRLKEEVEDYLLRSFGFRMWVVYFSSAADEEGPLVPGGAGTFT
ncbi:hypothetical protein NPIL_534781 [Nephila pilipes]|uniref:Uncharacterized protein n=1 Tax=Nephila pilipes TaxID=299642 RepID=A0A8X6U084_NEPPI|nr:hypothetical protein NPIL_534781 [Nephila pilipes]